MCHGINFLATHIGRVLQVLSIIVILIDCGQHVEISFEPCIRYTVNCCTLAPSSAERTVSDY